MESKGASAQELNDSGVAAAQRRQLQEAADFFRKATVADPSFAVAQQNLGNALAELGDVAGAIAAFERAIELNPRAAETLNNLGILRSKQGDYARAIQALGRAVELNPNYGSAFNNLGIALASSYRMKEAVAALRRAVALSPGNAEAHNNLGLALVETGRPDEGIGLLEKAIEQKPGYADAHRNLGIALTDAGRLDEALVQFEKALELAPEDHDVTRMNRSRTLFLRGDYEGGWRDYEFRFYKPENIRVAHEAPRWDGSPLAGRTLLVEAEQGAGDTIQFVRCLAEIKRKQECRIVLAVEPALVPLLKGVAGVDDLMPQSQRRPRFDVWSPLLSLPAVMSYDPRQSPVEIPYLRADAARIEQWRARLASLGGVKIGIAWQGNRFNKVDYRRSFPLTQFAPLGKLHGLTLVSLQKGPGSEQLDTLTEFDLVSLGSDFDAAGRAFLDTAAMMKSLDLVITADTSIGHLAGALGVPVWLPLAMVPDWRWGLTGDRTPWYPTMRLFRQPALRDWDSVFAQMAEAAQAEFPALRPKKPEEFVLATSGFNRLARTRHGPLVYNRHDPLIGKSLAELGELSENQNELFRQIVRPGATVVEAAAKIGAHTVELARLVGDRGVVYAFEPQRLPFQTLCGNVALSSIANVRCHQVALGEKSNWPVAKGGSSDDEPAPVVAIDDLKLPACHLLKLDVGGSELAAIRGAAATIGKFRPMLYVANERPEQSAPLIEALMGLGYKLFWHLSAYYNPQNYYSKAVNPFGNMVSPYMLGVHSSMATDIQGLPPVTSPQSDWRRPV
jgi:FkbM family methyltransferase